MNESYNDNVPLIRVINDNDSFNGSLNETQVSIYYILYIYILSLLILNIII